LVRQYLFCEEKILGTETDDHSGRGVGSGAEAEKTAELRVN